MMPDIRVMTPADIPLGMRLKEEAGWNQTLEDWQRFLQLSPSGSFVASIDGVDLGTVCTFTFDDIGWIAMMLVDKRSRGQGVGKALMSHAIAYLESQGVTSIRLDATELGRPVYLKLGFVDQFELNRYAGTLPVVDMPYLKDVEGIKDKDWDQVIALDTQLMSTPRGSLLKSLAGKPETTSVLIRNHGQVAGYMFIRPGANATFIGPCVAITPEGGQKLLSWAMMVCSGHDVILDIPASHRHANEWATDMRLEIQRPLIRMCRGKKVRENVTTLWASSGPEKG
jgi:GNAT superfamily N-acetyltransferase